MKTVRDCENEGMIDVYSDHEDTSIIFSEVAKKSKVANDHDVVNGHDIARDSEKGNFEDEDFNIDDEAVLSDASCMISLDDEENNEEVIENRKRRQEYKRPHNARKFAVAMNDTAIDEWLSI